MNSLRPYKLISAALSLLMLLIIGSPRAEAQGLLGLPRSLSAESGALLPLPIAEPVAAACKTRGESKDHCARVNGFCHACTDAYASCKTDRFCEGDGSCKGDANAARPNGGSTIAALVTLPTGAASSAW